MVAADSCCGWQKFQAVTMEHLEMARICGYDHVLGCIWLEALLKLVTG